MKKSLLFLTLIGSSLVFAACSAGTSTIQSNPTATPVTNSSQGSTTTSNTAANSTTGTTFTMTQVSQHNSAKDCWLVVDGSVYDVTKFIPNHPGGNEILQGCGKDATALFEGERKHRGPEAQSLLPTLKIGTLTQ